MLSGVEENTTTFFYRIDKLFPLYSYKNYYIKFVYRFIQLVFWNKYRDNKENYFSHLYWTTILLIDVFQVKDYRVIILALIHDFGEDIWWAHPVLIRLLFGADIASWMTFLTKKSPKHYFGATLEEQKILRNKEYYQNFKYAPEEPFQVKICDIIQNSLTLWGTSLQKRKNKILQIYTIFLPLLKDRGYPPEILEDVGSLILDSLDEFEKS
jgi:(p)ppGpp synthase/HD superfamily hydrolase